ncbi:hypothetical protein P153DRAFT_94438 [Dothidotthia symphoricarpi CBS 119687]|uniref:Uncharacterized protein n=1 Tax=Dothidotthia symphoricarpi CBS 119687 TaxID=1392245 RepID=A0A6A6A3Y2_9PLEO|nr:uncharacterized protein P153DRAFT_94438 [Dothidotthia symphoricarpi CBS 119687]KAF2125824.1 hypothetical protein P153DRAFT_94438 [Dothidotthia symphoricarpi CBS 119687]
MQLCHIPPFDRPEQYPMHRKRASDWVQSADARIEIGNGKFALVVGSSFFVEHVLEVVHSIAAGNDDAITRENSARKRLQNVQPYSLRER